MKCEHCLKKIEHPIQESKEDYWLCSCGDYHKNKFPYTCPIKEMKEGILKILDKDLSDNDFKEHLFGFLITQSK